MIPLKDDNPTRTVPFVTYGIIFACVAVFLWEVSLGERAEAAIYAFGLVPDVLMGHAHLPHRLALVPPWLTVFTSMFLHGGWTHLLGNMLYLYVFGNHVERSMGHARYLAFYFAGGFVATMAQTLMTLAFGSAAEARVPNLGASGAIAAVLGAYFVLYPKSTVRGLVVIFPVQLSAWFFLGAWFLYQLIEANFGIFGSAANGGGVAFFAHVGGFVFGAIVAWLLTGAGVVAPQDRSAALRTA